MQYRVRTEQNFWGNWSAEKKGRKSSIAALGGVEASIEDRATRIGKGAEDTEGWNERNRSDVRGLY